jgi:urease accessory protein UreF
MTQRASNSAPAIPEAQFTPDEARDLRGEVLPLVEQLGTPSSVVPAWRSTRVTNAAELRTFLHGYVREILVPIELPAIARARAHAERGELRELIAFCKSFDAEPRLRELGAASQRVGRSQLRRLHPLSDLRFLQRLRRAVDANEVGPWHTVVFGVTLAIYSIPLRQGLHHYARQVLGGYVEAAARPLHLSAVGAEEMLDEACAPLAAGVEGVVNAYGGAAVWKALA